MRDAVITGSGAHRPIRWLGYRRTGCRNHPHPLKDLPARAAARAFGPGRPAHDFRVSQGHALRVDVVDEVLLPAIALVDGVTMSQESIDSATYRHVKRDSHDSLPAEGYLDMGNRAFFAESELGAFVAALVAVIRSQLRAWAASLGRALDGADPSAGLHLVVDGARVAPVARGLVARFRVPAGSQDIWLISAAGRPCSVDGRALGICVGRSTISNGFAPPHAIEAAEPPLRVRSRKDGVRRGTAGRARLPAAPLAQHVSAEEKGFFFHVELAGPALPRWVASAVGSAAGANEPCAALKVAAA